MSGPMLMRLFPALLILATSLGALSAHARPAVVIDAASGRVIYAQDATAPWYPASLTKLMTTYVVLSAIREGRVTPDTPLLYTAAARAMPASKMGFPVNTIVTVDNALKLLMVKSANDIAVTLAEGVGGSVPAFVAEMNRTAQRLGMTQSRFRNPNGWHDPEQVTSARDMAILARAIYRDFPRSEALYRIRALQLGDTVIRGHNSLLGRFPGADGMKTGYTCPSGFNLVASATHGQRRLIAVVLGQKNAKVRTQRAAELLRQGFDRWSFWRTGQDVATLPPVGGAAPNLREELCSRKKGVVPEATGETEDDGTRIEARRNGVVASGFAAEAKPLLLEPPPVIPVPIFLGANPNGPREYISLADQLVASAQASAPETARSNAKGNDSVPMPVPRPRT